MSILATAYPHPPLLLNLLAKRQHLNPLLSQLRKYAVCTALLSNLFFSLDSISCLLVSPLWSPSHQALLVTQWSHQLHPLLLSAKNASSSSLPAFVPMSSILRMLWPMVSLLSEYDHGVVNHFEKLTILIISSPQHLSPTAATPM